MKYLKRFNESEGGDFDYPNYQVPDYNISSKKVKEVADKLKDIKLHKKSLIELRKEKVEKIVKEMNPPCEDVVQDIKDIFLEWIDQGIELDEIQLSIPKDNGLAVGIYHPIGWKGNSGNIYYHSIYGELETEGPIVSFLEKNNKLYYEIVFGVDFFKLAKKIKGVEYLADIDPSSKDFDHIFKFVKDCAEDISERLKNMYSNVKFIKSGCFIPTRMASWKWKKCDTVPNINSSRITWLVEISN